MATNYLQLFLSRDKELFSLPLTSGWAYDLLWSTESGRSDTVGFPAEASRGPTTCTSTSWNPATMRTVSTLGALVDSEANCQMCGWGHLGQPAPQPTLLSHLTGYAHKWSKQDQQNCPQWAQAKQIVHRTVINTTVVVLNHKALRQSPMQQQITDTPSSPVIKTCNYPKLKFWC